MGAGVGVAAGVGAGVAVDAVAGGRRSGHGCCGGGCWCWVVATAGCHEGEEGDQDKGGGKRSPSWGEAR